MRRMTHTAPRREPVPVLTRQHLRVQDATVARLQDVVDQAERYLAAHPDRIEGAARDKLCPCGIAAAQCRCPLWSDVHARRAG